MHFCCQSRAEAVTSVPKTGKARLLLPQMQEEKVKKEVSLRHLFLSNLFQIKQAVSEMCCLRVCLRRVCPFLSQVLFFEDEHP